MRIKPMKQRLMIIIGFVLLCLQILKAQEKVNIWQGTACRKNVEMTAYLAKGGSKMAVIVCPGGSYLWHDMNGEGHEVGKWLHNNGISAFVLHTVLPDSWPSSCITAICSEESDTLMLWTT